MTRLVAVAAAAARRPNRHAPLHEPRFSREILTVRENSRGAPARIAAIDDDLNVALTHGTRSALSIRALICRAVISRVFTRGVEMLSRFRHGLCLLRQYASSTAASLSMVGDISGARSSSPSSP